MIDKVTAGGASGIAPNQRAELREAAKAFEAVFARQMIGAMRAAKLGDEALGNGGVEQFQELMDARLADGVAAQGGLGIAAMLLKQFGAEISAETGGAPRP